MEGWVDLPHLPDEVDHGDCIGWHTMIRPPQVVQLSHLQGGFTRIRGLEEGIFTLPYLYTYCTVFHSIVSLTSFSTSFLISYSANGNEDVRVTERL